MQMVFMDGRGHGARSSGTGRARREQNGVPRAPYPLVTDRLESLMYQTVAREGEFAEPRSGALGRQPRIESMRAAYLEQTGPPEVIQVGALPRPEPGPGQVLVRVHAAALNPIDLYIRSGLV